VGRAVLAWIDIKDCEYLNLKRLVNFSSALKAANNFPTVYVDNVASPKI
jgi:hypothetical protein